MVSRFGPGRVSMLMLSLAAALALLWISSPVVWADDYQCTGAVGSETKDNVNVPDGASCTLNGTTVEGNVIVGTNSTLTANGVDVDGNVQAEGSSSVTVQSGSHVGGSIQIVQGGAANIRNTNIDSDLQFFENDGSISAADNTIGGNLQADENTGGLTINDNSIDGNLQCNANNPPPTGSGNTAASLEDQCSGLGGDGGGGGGGGGGGDDDDYQCTGAVGSETKDNVNVPDGAACTLNGTTVEGNVIVGTNSTLTANGVDVDGNVQAEGSSSVTVQSGSHVGGSIQIVQGGAANIRNTHIDSDLQFFENDGSISAADNTIGGNLQADENTGGLTITDNSIDGNLQCNANNPPPTGSGNTAASLEDQCSGLGGGGGGGGGGGDDDDIQIYGRIDSFPPAPYTGAWMIDGSSYTANSDTEFEQDEGAFAVGVCVEVEAEASTPSVAEEIETEEDYKCSGRDSGDDDEAEGELYGIVSSFPSNLIGTWVIGGKEFEATSDTEFERDGMQFAVGVTVEVEFTTNTAGVNRAQEIEIEYDSDGDDDDDHGDAPGREGHAYGILNSRPSGTIGPWVISNISYQANSDTELDDDDDLVVGSRVKVEYTVLSNGTRLAHELEDTDDDGDVGSDDHFKLIGFVQQMPASGFIGTWRVADTDFVAGLYTEFEQEHGTFAVGSYVEVEYSVDNGVRHIHEIESEVPPGAGDDDDIGRIQSLNAAAQAASATTAQWRIGGRVYTVIPATQMVDNAGDLVVGANVLVNSYVAAGGANIATRIETVILDEVVRLPLVAK